MLRKMKLPQDIDIMGETAITSFQYPENPEWGIQGEEQEQIRDMLNKLKRFWPVLALLRLVSPSFRDILLGHIWEEDGATTGVSMYQRRTKTDYYISSISVLPEYRRRGIARKLLTAILDEVKAQGGGKILLDVISENFPAYVLYEKLGFEHFSGSIHLNYNKDELPEQAALPAGYETVNLKPNDRDAAYQLNQRIVPEHVKKYKPVTRTTFRGETFLMRILEPLLGVRSGKVAVRSVETGEIVAYSSYQYRTGRGGVNEISLRVDPAHSSVSGYLLHWLTRKVQGMSPGRKLEISLPAWQEHLAKAALEIGFTERYTYHTMGLIVAEA